MTLDLFHAHLEEPDIREPIRKAGAAPLHVHVADTNRQGLGRGHLDVGPPADALRAIGYAGAVVLEVTPPGPDPFCSIKDGGRRDPGPVSPGVDRRLRQHLGERG